jgi:hypothetical protein
VSDSHTGRWDDPDGYRFKGRFGTDLQVLLPGQSFISEMIEQVPILEYHRTQEMSFSMRHLALRADQPKAYLAVLRPLIAGRSMLRASAIIQDNSIIGVNVFGDGITDRHFFSRGGVRIEDADFAFEGRYSAIAHRPQRTDLLLLDGRLLRLGDAQVESEGPAIQASLFADHTRLICKGRGKIRVRIRGCVTSLDVAGLTSLQLPA